MCSTTELSHHPIVLYHWAILLLITWKLHWCESENAKDLLYFRCLRSYPLLAYQLITRTDYSEWERQSPNFTVLLNSGLLCISGPPHWIPGLCCETFWPDVCGLSSRASHCTVTLIGAFACSFANTRSRWGSAIEFRMDFDWIRVVLSQLYLID